MEKLIVDKTKNTPYINLDISKNIFEIKGPSYSEDVVEVYAPILEWIDQEIPKLDGELCCNLHFDVLNSVAHKKVFQILIKLTEYFQNGKKIKVQWFYDEDDEDIMEMGEDLTDLIELPFELVSVENDFDDDEPYEFNLMDE